MIKETRRQVFIFLLPFFEKRREKTGDRGRGDPEPRERGIRRGDQERKRRGETADACVMGRAPDLDLKNLTKVREVKK